MLNFRLKKKIHNNRMATEEHDVAKFLPFYTDLGSLRPVDYDMPIILSNMYNNLDGEVNEILAKTGFDDLNNGSFYDMHIDKVLAIAKDELYKQRESHLHVIKEIRSIEHTRLEEILKRRAEIQSKLDEYTKGDEAQ